MTVIRIAIVGLGKIARDQHIPAIAGTGGIELVAIASRKASIDGTAHFATEMKSAHSRPRRSGHWANFKYPLSAKSKHQRADVQGS